MSNIITTFSNFITEKNQLFDRLVLYRGEEKDFLHPTDNLYSFFAQKVNVASGYGDYVYRCIFKPLNLFISYDRDSIQELYDNGFKLRDEYIEFNWSKGSTSGGNMEMLYDYNIDGVDNGYKSVDVVVNSPYFSSDTWEMIEHSDGVLDYIKSKYDGVVLLEGGDVTYYLRTDKIIECELVD